MDSLHNKLEQGEPSSVTYKEVADTMNCLWHGGMEANQYAEVLENKKLYTSPQPAPVQQEPVAWYVDFGNEDEPNYASIGEKPIEKMAIIRPLVFGDTPPQRTWVGLTDEDIERGCNSSWVHRQAFESAVWWAEAKLKEKNQ
jgi:hypothetical protein